MTAPLRPLALNYPATRQLEVFAVDDDGALKVVWKSDNGTWNPPHPLSGRGFAGPGAPLSGVYYEPAGTLEVFRIGRGAAHGVWKAPHVQDQWRAPFQLAAFPAVTGDAHSVAVHYPPARTLEVFAVGDDGGVHATWKSPTVGWQPSFRLANASGQAPGGAPIAAAHFPPADTLEVFVAGGNEGIIGFWKAPHVQHNWQPPFTLPGTAGTVPQRAGIAALHFPPSQCLEVFYVDKRGALRSMRKPAGAAWQGPHRLSGDNFAPPGAAVTAVHYPSAGQLEVHVVDNLGRVCVQSKAGNGTWAPEPHPLTADHGLVKGAPLASAAYPVNDQLEVFAGDQSYFARILWKHHNGIWAPCLTPLGARTGAGPAPTLRGERVSQVSATPAFLDAGARGIDLGPSTTHNGRHWVFFGDVPRSGRGDGPAHDADAVAWASRLTPDQVSFELIRSGRYFAPITVRRPDGSLLVPLTDQTPTGAFSHGEHAYVFYLIFDKPDASGYKEPNAYLTRTANPGDGKPFEQVFRWGENEFWQVAPTVVDNAAFDDLPSDTGRGLVLLGGGVTDGNQAAVHLAWLPLTPGQAPSAGEIRYHRGAQGWSPPGEPAGMQPLWLRPPGYTSVSLTYVAQAQRWIALYSNASPFGIGGENRPRDPVVARVASRPTGPWSAEIEIFNPCRDGAYARYMHWPGIDTLDEQDPSGLRDGTGWAYGAFILEPLTQWHPADRSVTLHYLLSTSRPYQVMHMRTRFPVG
ncbi:DUF4185 domain-containing protein [Crossiella cryophila]|uniref:DUF4185 domain-containing protein n=1 Tax=Crossiella cryophila TaxID=43355 RepID=A0A7W7CC76_9PSEU|nr:DUF4185 domain-containing protein [Crossiella cryophila]MBB4678505.1 hypothetical protein [Crossiella cryophila]